MHIIDNDLAKNQPFRMPMDLQLNANHFLPPFHHILFIVAPNFTLHKLFEYIADITNQPPPLGRTKVTELKYKGVGKRAEKKVTNFFDTFVEHANFNTLEINGLINQYPLCDGNIWQSVLNSFTQNKYAKEDFFPLIKFLNFRIKKERELIFLLQPIFKEKTRNVEFCECFRLTEVLDFQRINTLKLEQFISYDENKFDQLPTSKRFEIALNAALHDIGDFYLSFFANIDLSIAIMIKNDESKNKILKSLLLPWLEAYIKEGANQNFISVFIDDIQSKASKYSGTLTISKMAEAVFIDQERAYTGGDSLKERQKNELNKWRSGRSAPSPEKLFLFVHRLQNIASNETLIESVEDAVFSGKEVTHLVWSINRLFNLLIEYDHPEKNLTKDMRKVALCNLLKHYQTHYDHWLNDWENT